MKGGKVVNLKYTKKDIGLKYKVGQIIYFNYANGLEVKGKILKYWKIYSKGYLVEYKSKRGVNLTIHLFKNEVYAKITQLKSFRMDFKGSKI